MCQTPWISFISGVAEANATGRTRLVVERFKPSKIVEIGSAGVLHPDLNIGDTENFITWFHHDLDLSRSNSGSPWP